MRSLSGIDGAFLHLETPDTPMHVGSLHLFEPTPAGRFAAQLERRLRERLDAAPILRRRLASLPFDLANPVWVDDDHVDLERHLQRTSLPAPGTHAQLEVLAARLHAEPLDRARPLWRIVVIDGLESGEVALYFQIHHAMLDGQASVVLARTLYDLAPRPARTRPAPTADAAHAEHPSIGALALEALRHDAGQYLDLVRHSADAVRTLAGMAADSALGRTRESGARASVFAPKTALNVPITGERGFAAGSLPLDALKRIAAAHDAKLNDVVLALSSGVLRRWLEGHGGIPEEPLTAWVPVSLRDPGDEAYTTQATMILVGLATHLADPVERLLAIRDSANEAKALARRARDVLPLDFPTLGVPWILHAGAWLYGRLRLADAVAPLGNLVVSNVAGPQAPLYLAGTPMRTYWPMSIVEHGLGLNVTVMSYDGAMGFGFTTARSAVPDARELTLALGEAFDELAGVGHGVGRRRPAVAGGRR